MNTYIYHNEESPAKAKEYTFVNTTRNHPQSKTQIYKHENESSYKELPSMQNPIYIYKSIIVSFSSQIYKSHHICDINAHLINLIP